MSLKIIHLTNGEDIVGTVTVKEKDVLYEIKNAHKVIQKTDGVILAPLAPAIKENQVIELSGLYVLYMLDPNEEFEKNYLQKFGDKE